MSGLIATNDELINQFLKDENYQVLESGILLTRICLRGWITETWRVKKLTNNEGYFKFRYKGKGILIHRLVYAAFVGPLDRDKVINHIDGNPSNNHPSNLELITQKENMLHANRVLGKKPRSTGYKVTQEIADEIRRLVAKENMRACELVKKYSVAKSTISYILNNKTWVKAA